jgi:hypothetical protein
MDTPTSAHSEGMTMDQREAWRALLAESKGEGVPGKLRDGTVVRIYAVTDHPDYPILGRCGTVSSETWAADGAMVTDSECGGDLLPPEVPRKVVWTGRLHLTPDSVASVTLYSDGTWEDK